nr:LysR family transcriptional regulator [Thaumasiovibrio subtropicus]
MAQDLLNHLELKSLRILIQLLETKSVTAVADTMAMRPPSVTYHLNKLRDTFEDPLLVPVGRKLVLTPKAEELHLALVPVLKQLELALNVNTFEPVNATGVVKIAVQDFGAIAVIPRLLDELEKSAPNITIEVVNWPQNAERLMQSGEIDLAINAITQLNSQLHGYQLGDMSFSVLMDKQHPLAQAHFSDRAVFDYAHVRVHPTGLGEMRIDALARSLNVTRNVSLKASTFSLVAQAIQDSERVAIVATGAANVLSRDRFAVMPFPAIEPVPLHCFWHQRSHHDPVHKFVRKHLIAISQTLFNHYMNTGEESV